MSGRIRKVLGTLLPIFKKDNLEEVVDQIIQESPEIQNAVSSNPDYRSLLKRDVTDIYRKYRGVMWGSKAIDSWDRLTSGLGAALELIPGVGQVASLVEEVAEGIPKAAYAAYYVHKTGDKAAVPYWMMHEVASLTPFGLGDFVDMGNAYFKRARKELKNTARYQFMDRLEKRVERPTRPLPRSSSPSRTNTPIMDRKREELLNKYKRKRT
jgi:hypothetical protein